MRIEDGRPDSGFLVWYLLGGTGLALAAAILWDVREPVGAFLSRPLIGILAPLAGLAGYVVTRIFARPPRPAQELGAAAGALAERLRNRLEVAADTRGLSRPEMRVRCGQPGIPTRRDGDVAELSCLLADLPEKRLVITGPAGAGKTSAGILLMRALLGDNGLPPIRDGIRRVPFPADPAGWDPARESLHEWLAGEVAAVLGDREAAGRLVRERHVVPFLDDLDDVEQTRAVLGALDPRRASIAEPALDFVLLADADTYRRATGVTGGLLVEHVELYSPTADAAAEYLRAALPVDAAQGDRRLRLDDLIHRRPALGTEPNTPLRLALIARLFRHPEFHAREMSGTLTVTERSDQLIAYASIAHYAARVVTGDKRLDPLRGSPGLWDLRRSLGALATAMKKQGVQRIDPRTLHRLLPGSAPLRVLLPTLLGALAGLAANAPVLGVAAGVGAGLVSELRGRPHPRGAGLALTVLAVLTATLAGGGLLHAALVSVPAALLAGLLSRLRLSPLVALAAGLPAALGLIPGHGLLTALPAGLLLGLAAGRLDHALHEHPAARSPREAQRTARRHALTTAVSAAALLGGAAAVLSGTTGLVVFLGAALTVWWARSDDVRTGLALLQARRTAPGLGLAMLEFACDEQLLRRSGAAYEFWHPTFRDHLSPPTPDTGPLPDLAPGLGFATPIAIGSRAPL